ETRMTGDVLLDGPRVSLSRDVNGQRLETVAGWPAGMLFWFPATAALGLLVRAAGGRPAFPALTLDKSAAFVLRPVEVYLTAGQEEVLVVARQRVVARPFSIRWDNQERTVWLDEYGWPVKMVRGDGLAAVETRYVRYQPAIQRDADFHDER
ncbi:MAG: hypothetical protein L0322_31610, partial [Chloroflexi bacterium]|nr:hypothetical protein [Chloroflexota bacterium]